MKSYKNLVFCNKAPAIEISEFEFNQADSTLTYNFKANGGKHTYSITDQDITKAGLDTADFVRYFGYLQKLSKEYLTINVEQDCLLTLDMDNK